jgi:hypothetical protein
MTTAALEWAASAAMPHRLLWERLQPRCSCFGVTAKSVATEVAPTRDIATPVGLLGVKAHLLAIENGLLAVDLCHQLQRTLGRDLIEVKRNRDRFYGSGFSRDAPALMPRRRGSRLKSLPQEIRPHLSVYLASKRTCLPHWLSSIASGGSRHIFLAKSRSPIVPSSIRASRLKALPQAWWLRRGNR